MPSVLPISFPPGETQASSRLAWGSDGLQVPADPLLEEGKP